LGRRIQAGVHHIKGCNCSSSIILKTYINILLLLLYNLKKKKKKENEKDKRGKLGIYSFTILGGCFALNYGG
jgi:hypothetical protein